MRKKISNRVLTSWRGEAPPELLLCLEHLETIEEIPPKFHLLKLLKEVNIGYITGVLIERAVIILIKVNKNNTIALKAAFISNTCLLQENNKYQLSPKFFNEIDFVERHR